MIISVLTDRGGYGGGRMKKHIMFCLAMCSVFALCGCSESGLSVDSNVNSSLMPGRDRIWYYDNFDDDEEAKEFIINLSQTPANEKFSFGFSHFTTPENYKNVKAEFSGHILTGTDNTKDIYNSTYDVFWISSYYRSKDDYITITYLPFYPDSVFNKENVSSKITIWGNIKLIDFTYCNELIMNVEYLVANTDIDENNFISELLENFQVIN